MKYLLFILLFACFRFGVAQNDPEALRICLECDTINVDSLKKVYRFNKNVPTRYEKAIYIAMSFFPELENAKTEFKETRIRTTLNTRPTIVSLLFRQKDKRRYIIRINNRDKDSLIALENVPLKASIGLFGHEFCHLIDYGNRNVFGIMKRLIDYTSKKSKEKFEKEIDKMTIERGLGRHLYYWSHFVLHESDASQVYKEYKRLIYLEPDEIMDEI